MRGYNTHGIPINNFNESSKVNLRIYEISNGLLPWDVPLAMLVKERVSINYVRPVRTVCKKKKK